MPLMSLFPLSVGVCGGWEHRGNVVFMDTSKNTVLRVVGQFIGLLFFVGFCILMGFFLLSSLNRLSFIIFGIFVTLLGFFFLQKI